ncbi:MULTISPECIES: PAS domain-containing sensor histidine kinase [unclassified Oceanispirochaeta]|nr:MULTISPECIES: ATP-binding protein [unclassified Oceanispirochaeta]MBF9016984.1 GHKL domain-containing protein [Oceanispirochaeta sp. M2]NPD73347.1 GHKL domain-containing protein [Oceanispirochaeta sp. M1]
MNEKRFLIYLLILIFVLFSVMGVIIIETHIQHKQVSLLLEYEKLLGRYYNLYTSGESLDDQMTAQILGFAFYNYYGDPLYIHGTARPKIESTSERPFFNKERKSIVIQRDMMNPFIPIFRNMEDIEKYNQGYTQNIETQSKEYREQMIRYTYVEIIDPLIYSTVQKFKLLQFIIPVIIISIVFFIWHLYTKNISYRKQIGEQERLVVLGTAARTLTHEIKNPLSSIRLQSTIIKRSSCRLHEESLRIINEEVDRLSLLTERVGDYLRHPEGEPQRCDLNIEVSKTMKRYSHNLSYSTRDDVFPVHIDPDRFRSILENLLNNALQSESDHSDISIDLDTKDDQVVLIVKDKGKGIPPENLKHLFDPFFTTKSTGSGIGLAIVHSFVSAAHGDLKIESDPGMGTSVRITFPLLEKEEHLS